MNYSISDMCKAGQTTERAIRWWEGQGLLGFVERSKGDNRLFTLEQIQRARIIGAAQAAGFSLDDIRDNILKDWNEQSRQAVVLGLEQMAEEIRNWIKALPEANQPEFDL